MKILIYCHHFAPSVGGLETAVQLLADGLARMRTANGEPEFEVTLATPYPQGTLDDRSLAFRVIRNPSLFTLLRLIRWADVLHVSGPALAPLFLAWCLRTPAVIEHHGYQAVCPNGLLLKQPAATVCSGHFIAREYPECLRCFAHSYSWPDSILKLITMFPRRFFTYRVAANLAISRHVMHRQQLPRTQVVYYGIQLPGLDSSETFAAHLSRPLTFAYVGRFVQEKGVAILLQAAALLRKEGKQFSLLLVGDGEQRTAIEEFLQRDNLREIVRITGYLKGDQLAAEFRNVNVLVMPSLCEETAGLAAIEQMVRGRLVVASAIGGLAEIVEGSGVTFPAGDAIALAARMRTIIENPSQFRELALHSQTRSRELFRVQRMIEEHAGVYRRVAGATHNSPGD